MRVFMYIGLLVLGVGACGLVLDSKTSSTEAVPDASTTDHGQQDGGGCNTPPDGGFGHDGGGYFPDGGTDGGTWYPDAYLADGGGYFPDGGYSLDGGQFPADAAWPQPDGGF